MKYSSSEKPKWFARNRVQYRRGVFSNGKEKGSYILKVKNSVDRVTTHTYADRIHPHKELTKAPTNICNQALVTCI